MDYSLLDMLLSNGVSILIFALGIWYTVKESKKKKQEKIEFELEESKRRQLKSEIDSLSDTINELAETVKQLQDSVQNISAVQKRLISINRLNGRYTNELAQLVMTLAEGIRDQHLDGNITRAVMHYRKFESSALASMVSGTDGLLNVHAETNPPTEMNSTLFE